MEIGDDGSKRLEGTKYSEDSPFDAASRCPARLRGSSSPFQARADASSTLQTPLLARHHCPDMSDASCCFGRGARALREGRVLWMCPKRASNFMASRAMNI